MFFILITISPSFTILAQKNIEAWSRTTKQVQNGTINQDLIGEWKSFVNNPLLSFQLNPDRTFSWTFMDTVKIDSDSAFWTKPQMYWTVNGLDLYTLGPKDEKNKWSYAKFGIYYLKKIDYIFLNAPPKLKI